MEICGLPLVFWIIVLLGLYLLNRAMESAPPRSAGRPPAHPPGWKNIKKGKR